MERETTVGKGEKKYQSAYISGRTLKMPGLKVTDYFLFKEARAYFEYDMRQLFTLGLRLLYRALHDVKFRAIVLELAQDIKGEDLDRNIELKYTNFINIEPE